jgi:hypothetical protein
MATTHEKIGAALTSGAYTKEEQFIIRWQYGYLGDFETALMKAICAADETNLELLSKGFPMEVGAYLDWCRGNMGDRIRKKGLEI